VTSSLSPRAARSDCRDTPIRRQYERLKARYPRCILLFQLGDFFETFEADAQTVSRVCGVTLTSREFGKGDRVPLAGVPITRLDHYLARLIEAGLHVAVAEQVSAPGDGLVERAVTRVVTPGTLAEPGLLRDKENNYLAAVLRGRAGAGLAYVDVTTGEFAVTQLDGADAETRLRAELERLGPAEVLVPEGQTLGLPAVGHPTICPAWRFDEPAARERLCAQLDVVSLEGFGCADLPLAVRAAGAILFYLEENNRHLLPNLADLRTYSTASGMTLDSYTRRNLELLRNGRTGRIEGSLLAVLDRTRTPMGGRLLRRWISQPLLDPAEIDARLNAVETLVQAKDVRTQLRGMLSHVGDLERRVGRIVQGLAGPRDLLDLADALRAVAVLTGLVESCAGLTAAPPVEGRAGRPGVDEPHPSPVGPPLWPREGEDKDEPHPPESARREGTFSLETGTGGLTVRPWLDPCSDIVDLVERGIAPLGSGQIIRPGYSAELDTLISTAAETRRCIAELEHVERQRTGIKSLKVGYNKVFGYYLEVTRPNLPSVPPDYRRRQTLVQAERFVTPALAEWESEILQAEVRIQGTEHEVFEALRGQVAGHAPRLRRLASTLAHLDVLAALADLADERGYRRPIVVEGAELRIVAARHPVVEASLEPGAFIPNDCHLCPGECTLMLLTGPNMAGKSTYLREVALIVLLAQIGSFVPAREARVGLVDRIFTRVGAQDDIAAGASTFMVEMMETAMILRNATPRSLIVLDEIGRGTSTLDGLSIARAVVEEVQQRVGARTLFATHFHELASLADERAGIRVFNVAVAEQDGEVVFLRKVVPGAADRSYGIQVARLAGLPPRVTSRAAEILRELELVGPAAPAGQRVDRPVRPLQLPLAGFDPVPGTPADLLDELLSLDPANLTPLEALTKIWELQRRAGRCY